MHLLPREDLTQLRPGRTGVGPSSNGRSLGRLSGPLVATQLTLRLAHSRADALAGPVRQADVRHLG